MYDQCFVWFSTKGGGNFPKIQGTKTLVQSHDARLPHYSMFNLIFRLRRFLEGEIIVKLFKAYVHSIFHSQAGNYDCRYKHH
jgi:hypothetical protein